MPRPSSSAEFPRTRSTSKQHPIRVILRLQSLSETIFPCFPHERVCFGWMGGTGLLAEFVIAVKGLELDMDVIAHKLFHDRRALHVNTLDDRRGGGGGG